MLVEIDLDGTGRTDVSTGVGFYDHMLDLVRQARPVRPHRPGRGRPAHRRPPHRRGHRDRARARRSRRPPATRPASAGSATRMIPMDECLVQAAVDLSGRPYLVHNEPDGRAAHDRPDYATTLTRHVFESFVYHAAIALHVNVHAGRDWHHITEAQYKAVARALRAAVELDPRVHGRAVAPRACSERSQARRRPRLRLGQPALGAARARAGRGRRHRDRRPRPRPTTADGLVVPGVGAYAACMAGLHAVAGELIVAGPGGRGRPVLGICVGMQVLFDAGVEHGVESVGLGVLPGRVEPLQRAGAAAHGLEHRRRAPAVDAVRRAGRRHPLLLRALLRRARHRRPDVTAATHGEPFVAAVERGTVSATQFHPEKSGDAGAALLENWLRLGMSTQRRTARAEREAAAAVEAERVRRERSGRRRPGPARAARRRVAAGAPVATAAASQRHPRAPRRPGHRGAARPRRVYVATRSVGAARSALLILLISTPVLVMLFFDRRRR